MKKIALLLMVCVGILTPTAARADDGGFWDMLWHWDTKFSGYGTDIHLYCRDRAGNRVQNCDEWFSQIWNNPFESGGLTHNFATANNRLSDIRHEVNFRVSIMHSYGEKFPDSGNEPKVWALKTMGFYYLRLNRVVDVGVGAGTIDLFGNNVDRTWRPTFAASVVVGLGGAWFVRVEENYYWGTITGANLGQPGSTYEAKPKWAPSVALGIDFRRR